MKQSFQKEKSCSDHHGKNTTQDTNYFGGPVKTPRLLKPTLLCSRFVSKVPEITSHSLFTWLSSSSVSSVFVLQPSLIMHLLLLPLKTVLMPRAKSSSSFTSALITTTKENISHTALEVENAFCRRYRMKAATGNRRPLSAEHWFIKVWGYVDLGRGGGGGAAGRNTIRTE